MINDQLGLVERGQAFDSLIRRTVFTNMQGEKFNIEDAMTQVLTLLTHNRDNGGRVYLVGNGGSAAVVSHAITDFMNVCQLRAFTLHDSSLITCMANDFGYDQAFKRILNTVFCKNDLLIAISSSGKSLNICNAAKMAKALGGTVMTLSGFQDDNPLRKLGDYNFWLDSNDYGLVEIGHLFLLHNMSDRIGWELKQQNEQAELASLPNAI